MPTPEALNYVLKSIREIAKGKIITLFGCGGDRDKEKEKYGRTCKGIF